MIYCDDKSAISMTTNLIFHRPTMNIELCYNFITDQVSSSTIEVKFYSIKDLRKLLMDLLNNVDPTRS